MPLPVGFAIQTRVRLQEHYFRHPSKRAEWMPAPFWIVDRHWLKGPSYTKIQANDSVLTLIPLALLVLLALLTATPHAFAHCSESADWTTVSMPCIES
jgi:hypothetical protein